MFSGKISNNLLMELFNNQITQNYEKKIENQKSDASDLEH